MEEVGKLTREPGTERNRRYLVGGVGLHCGDGVEVLVCGNWCKLRVEWSERHGWYGVGWQQDPRSEDEADVILLLRSGLVVRW